MNDVSAPPSPHLLKILGITFGIAIAVGNCIGAGILRSPAIVAGEVPSAAIIIGLWVLGAVQAALGANIMAELATALPKSGGLYVYAQRALGDVFGLVVGWTTWSAKLAGIAATTVSFAEFLPLLWPAAGDHKIAVVVGVQVVLYAANIMGLREGRTLQELTSLIKVSMLFIFIVSAIVLVAPSEPRTILSSPVAFSWANLVLAFQLVRGAYGGWDGPIYFAGENTNAARNIPRALGFGILLTGSLYVGVNAALVHSLGLHGTAASPLPFTTVLGEIGGRIPPILFALTAMITVASCANANIMAAPRIIMALAQDGLLPRVFSRVNTGGSPAYAFAFTAIGSIALALSGTFALVFGLIGTLGTVNAILVDVSYFVLRRREPDLPRPYRAIGHPVLPLIVLTIEVMLIFLFVSANHVGGLVALGLGLFCVPFAMIARRGQRALRTERSHD